MDNKSQQDTRGEVQGEKWIIFVTGLTACGKSTIAKYLAKEMGLEFVEGDDYHPKANVEKMGHGQPLNDQDRKGWLEALRNESEHPRGGGLHVIVTCSALKRQYRDVLRGASQGAKNMLLRFIYLTAPEEVLYERSMKRKGHFAGADLVRSQVEAHEPPGPDEKDIIIVDASRPVEEVQSDALSKIRQQVQS